MYRLDCRTELGKFLLKRFRGRVDLLEKYKEAVITTERGRLGVTIKYTPLQQVHDLHRQHQADVIALSGSR